MLFYFLENYSFLFGENDLKILVEVLYKSDKIDLLEIVMFMPCVVQIIKSLPFEKRLIYMQELLYIGYQVKGKERNF